MLQEKKRKLQAESDAAKEQLRIRQEFLEQQRLEEERNAPDRFVCLLSHSFPLLLIYSIH